MYNATTLHSRSRRIIFHFTQLRVLHVVTAPDKLQYHIRRAKISFVLALCRNESAEFTQFLTLGPLLPTHRCDVALTLQNLDGDESDYPDLDLKWVVLYFKKMDSYNFHISSFCRKDKRFTQ